MGNILEREARQGKNLEAREKAARREKGDAEDGAGARAAAARGGGGDGDAGREAETKVSEALLRRVDAAFLAMIKAADE